MVQRLPPHKVRCGGRNSQGELNKEKTRDVLMRVYKGNTMKRAHSSVDQYLLSVWYMSGIILDAWDIAVNKTGTVFAFMNLIV